MSAINQAAAELEQWITEQLANGVSQEKLYFFLLQKGFAEDAVSSMLQGYNPTLNTAIIEQLPNKDTLPEQSWFGRPAHFFSYANINLTRTEAKRKVDIDAAQIYVLPDVIPAKLCEQLIIRSKRYFSPSLVIGENKNQLNSARTSSTALVRDVAPDADLKIRQAIATLMGIDPAYCEPLQIQRYEAGQEYQMHADWFDANHAGYEDNIKDGGQRTWTCLIYLNGRDDFQGGETHFRELNLRVVPQPGKACVWNNLSCTGEENRNTYHCGTKVLSGNKYILTAWFRARPYS